MYEGGKCETSVRALFVGLVIHRDKIRPDNSSASIKIIVDSVFVEQCMFVCRVCVGFNQCLHVCVCCLCVHQVSSVPER